MKATIRRCPNCQAIEIEPEHGEFICRQCNYSEPLLMQLFCFAPTCSCKDRGECEMMRASQEHNTRVWEEHLKKRRSTFDESGFPIH